LGDGCCERVRVSNGCHTIVNDTFGGRGESRGVEKQAEKQTAEFDCRATTNARMLYYNLPHNRLYTYCLYNKYRICAGLFQEIGNYKPNKINPLTLFLRLKKKANERVLQVIESR